MRKRCILKRTFAPVGQGAFYTERFYFPSCTNTKEFNTVYDCGTLYISKSKKKLVNDLIRKRSVDILFISHFDYDHVSLIPTLVGAAKNIKLIVLPLLHKKEKKILISLYRVLEKELDYSFGFVADLIEKPEKTFGDDSTIIRVKPWEENRREEEGKEINLDNIPPGTQTEIDSGSKLLKKNFWLYVPYNFYYEENAKRLDFMLKKAGINVDKLTNDENYLESLIKDKKYRRKIRKVYNSLEGDINSNSLVVYSGPFKVHTNHFFYRSNSIFRFCPSSKHCKSTFQNTAGCLYTGDMNLKDNKFNLKKIFSKYWKVIGTIQVPHHGSKNSFNPKNFKKCVFAPISTGKNQYGHPSIETLQKLISLNTCPILVTESVGFRQKWEMLIRIQ